MLKAEISKGCKCRKGSWKGRKGSPHFRLSCDLLLTVHHFQRIRVWLDKAHHAGGSLDCNCAYSILVSKKHLALRLRLRRVMTHSASAAKRAHRKETSESLRMLTYADVCWRMLTQRELIAKRPQNHLGEIVNSLLVLYKFTTTSRTEMATENAQFRTHREGAASPRRQYSQSSEPRPMGCYLYHPCYVTVLGMSGLKVLMEVCR